MTMITALEARRIALGAQGFADRARSAKPGLAQVRRVALRLGAIQIDPISVFVRSQYLPVFSRVGPYPVEVLDRLTYQRRELFEYMGHQACLMPTALYPLLRFRMAAYAGQPGWFGATDAAYVDSVLAQIAERGPLAATDLTEPGRRAGRFEAGLGKEVLSWLTLCGRLAVAGRRNLQQLYDLPERVLPAEVLAAPAPERDDARRELLMLAAAALGVATAKDLADYFSIGMGIPGIFERRTFPDSPRVPRLLGDLVDAGRLVPVRVDGWRHPAFLHPDAVRPPSEVDAYALLSPFDSLIWERDRTRRLFGFTYRSEIYVPAARREYGYYVLPFLCGESLAGRVDLKADRQNGTLAVLGAYVEPDADPKRVSAELATQLRRTVDWLGLDRVEVAGRGDLARPLARALASAR